MTPDEKSHVLQIWEKTIDVQMHFNDIEMRIRSIFVTVILALTGAIGWTLDKSYQLQITDSVSINFAILLLASGIIATKLFWFIDKHWYHKLLVGSVKQTLALDKKYGEKIPALGLTTSISGSSPLKNFGNSVFGRVAKFTKIVKKDSESFTGHDLRSTGKIDLFYNTPLRIMQLVFILSLFFGGILISSGDGTLWMPTWQKLFG